MDGKRKWGAVYQGNKYQTIVLGAGIAGLTAGHVLAEHNKEVVLFEKNDTYGGLCRSFCLDGFTFDTFAHVNFSKDSFVLSMMEAQVPYITHTPEALNYYEGKWVRNPVQNNLIDLDVEERINILKDFVSRKSIPVNNYEDWLKQHYGIYFTTNYPAKYTRKYWTVEPGELEIKWVEGRMYKPSLEEVLRGAMTKETPNVHYSKEIHYPLKGGFQAFVEPAAKNLDIQTNKEAVYINPNGHIIGFADGSAAEYDNLISTIPLDRLVSCIVNIPEEVHNAARGLDYTYGVLVSIAIKKPRCAPSLWFYIYDENIWPARVYAPEIKSSNNVPSGYSALQAEVYFSKHRPRKVQLDDIKKKTIEQLQRMKLFKENDILFADVREEPYANIMFTPEIYKNREIIHRYLDNLGIVYAGRFGEWDYLWTGQSVLSGKQAAEKILFRA